MWTTLWMNLWIFLDDINWYSFGNKIGWKLLMELDEVIWWNQWDKNIINDVDVDIIGGRNMVEKS